MTEQDHIESTDVEPDQPEVDQDQPETTPEQPENGPESAEEPEPDTFPREYVEKLRKEAADARVKAKRVDGLSRRLHVAMVAATGRLADPEDLEFSEDHLDDPEALGAALDSLLERKPHLGSRRVSGAIGQGAAEAPPSVDLAGLLRARA